MTQPANRLQAPTATAEPPGAGAAPLIRPTRPTAGDFALAGAALVLVGPLSILAGLGYGAGATVVAGLSSVVMPVALAWRRSHPAASAVIIYAAALLHFVAGAPVIATDLLIFVSLYAVTAYGPTWARRAGLAGALLGCLLQGLNLVVTRVGDAPAGFEPSGIQTVVAGALAMVLPAAMVLAVWALALVRKARVERLEAFAERAMRLEIERDQQAQIAAASERARIAREMHDVVAHSLSVVISQADGGRYAAEADPAAAEQALTTISDTGRTALADLRRILGVLRDGHFRDGEPDLAPQPTEADLETLLTPLRQAGMAVSLEHRGTPRQVPAPTGLSIYRIVQESLTNVLKHAGGAARTQVVLEWQPERLEVTVTDTGHGTAAGYAEVDRAPGTGGGQGVVGMRERATILGGTLAAGPQPAGGWLVQATIPVPPAPAPGTPPQSPPPHPSEMP